MLRIKYLFLFWMVIFTMAACHNKAAVDCGISAKVTVWLDGNANGVREDGEKPLPNVLVSVSGFEPTLTDKNGYVSFFSLRACDDDSWENANAVIEVPKGYKPTTPQAVPLISDPNGEYSFGLVLASP